HPRRRARRDEHEPRQREPGHAGAERRERLRGEERRDRAVPKDHGWATDRTASHATSDATTPSAVVSSSGSLSTAPVETANSTSPSSSAWKGWIARAIE